MYKQLCKRFSKTYRSRTQLENHMRRRIAQGNCNISYMGLDHENKLHKWNMKTDLPKWRGTDLECMKIPADDPQQKTLLVNKPIAVDYKIIKNHILIT